MIGSTPSRASLTGGLEIAGSVPVIGSCNSRQLVELARIEIPSLPVNAGSTILIAGSLFYNLRAQGIHRNDLLFIYNSAGSVIPVVLSDGTVEHKVKNDTVSIYSHIEINCESFTTIVLKAYGASVIKLSGGGTSSRMMEIRIEAVASVLTAFTKNGIYGCNTREDVWKD